MDTGILVVGNLVPVMSPAASGPPAITSESTDGIVGGSRVVVLALALSVEPVELRLVAAAAVLSSKMIDLLMESESPDGVVTADSVGGVTRVDCTGGAAWI